jgi:hypothetical protein
MTVDHFDDAEDFDDEEFEDFIQALGLPDRLPAVWLPAIEELAGAARESVLLRQVGELTAWVGERRQLTDEGDLTPDDAAEVMAQLGVSQADLLVCWETAVATDLVVVTEDGTAESNPDLWPTGDDEEDLGTWAAGFTQVLQSLLFEAELVGEEDLTFDSAAALMLPLFLAGERGEQIAELREILRAMEVEELADDAPWDAWVAAHGDPLTALLTRLSDHGAVVFNDETARLTPLATLVMREELVEGGIDIPLLPPPAEMTAADLLMTAGGRTAEELAELSGTWLSDREPAEAATDLLAAAAEAEPAGRFYASTILANLPAVPWETVVDDPTLGPYARSILGQDADPPDAAWLLMDAVSASADVMGDLNPEAVEVVTTQALPPGREEEALADAWRLPHPMAYEVLTLLGAHHPDKKIAKAARTAAHKALSAS